MCWLFLIGGGLATAAMFVISMGLNFLFGYGLGQTPVRAVVFGCVSVIVDAWKGLGPIFILALTRARRLSSAGAGSAVWVVCFVYSVSSAVGIVIQDRTTRTAGRDTVHASYEDVRQQMDEVQGTRRRLRHSRPASEVEAAIAAVLMRPANDRKSVRPVGALSINCSRVDVRTIDACGEIAVLRQELASAQEAARLDQQIAALRVQAEKLRGRGATVSSDPQGELFARLTRGWLTAKDVGFTLGLLLAAAIELVSAFGPAVLAAYAEASSRAPGAAANGKGRRVGLVLDYIADCIEPAATTSALASDELYNDYTKWCAKFGKRAMTGLDFIGEFDRSRIEQGLEQIKKFGNRYYGMRLVKAGN
jgi:hypothetical protein